MKWEQQAKREKKAAAAAAQAVQEVAADEKKKAALVKEQYTACKNTSKHTANILLAMHFDRRPNGQAPCSRHSKGVAKCLQYCLSFSFQQQTPTKP